MSATSNQPYFHVKTVTNSDYPPIMDPSPRIIEPTVPSQTYIVSAPLPMTEHLTRQNSSWVREELYPFLHVAFAGLVPSGYSFEQQIRSANIIVEDEMNSFPPGHKFPGMPVIDDQFEALYFAVEYPFTHRFLCVEDSYPMATYLLRRFVLRGYYQLLGRSPLVSKEHPVNLLHLPTFMAPQPVRKRKQIEIEEEEYGQGRVAKRVCRIPDHLIDPALLHISATIGETTSCGAGVKRKSSTAGPLTVKRTRLSAT